ncbi:hypothetical protein PR048_033399 [Dryococelus australis]|uniref:Uncharacterized protein n=1 Tax=Dryococelus australis TaxID=614101 RepID=A0ABQ9G4C1_9NEOP|nr:hypothetical protein PR048_033399 [Dryococelus australis]
MNGEAAGSTATRERECTPKKKKRTPRYPARSISLLNIYLIARGVAATVPERLARSPPTAANRAQSPAGSPDFRKWESCWAMPLVGGSSQGSPVSPRPFIPAPLHIHFITLIDSQDLAVRSRPNLFNLIARFHFQTSAIGRKCVCHALRYNSRASNISSVAE